MAFSESFLRTLPRGRGLGSADLSVPSVHDASFG